MSAHEPDSGWETTVLLADEDGLTRRMLAQVLWVGGVEVVAEAASAPDAVALAVDLRPDVVVIDPCFGGRPAVQAIRATSLLAPASRVLVVTREESGHVVEAIVAG